MYTFAGLLAVSVKIDSIEWVRVRQSSQQQSVDVAFPLQAHLSPKWNNNNLCLWCGSPKNGDSVVTFSKAIGDITSVVIEKGFPQVYFLYRLSNSLVKCLLEQGVLLNECLLFTGSMNSA